MKNRHFHCGVANYGIDRQTRLLRPTIRKYSRGDTVKSQSNVPDRPSKLD
jgi:hypothetical protein